MNREPGLLDPGSQSLDLTSCAPEVGDQRGSWLRSERRSPSPAACVQTAVLGEESRFSTLHLSLRLPKPQRDVFRLHSLLNYGYHLSTHIVQVCLVTQLG